MFAAQCTPVVALLSLVSMGLSDDHTGTLCRTLMACSDTLTHLDLSYNVLTDMFWHDVCWGNLSELQTLCLDNNDDDAIVALLPNLRLMSNLQHVKTGTDKWITRSIPEWHWLHRCVTLQSMEVSFGISDDPDAFYKGELYTNNAFWKGLVTALATSKHLSSVTINVSSVPIKCATK